MLVRIKSLKPIFIFWVLPPTIEPPPDTFCNVDGGRTEISVRPPSTLQKVTGSGSIVGGSFGVYLGRFERYNSWDIFRMPFEIAKDISHRFIYPNEHPRTWGLTIGLSLLLAILYLFTGNNTIEKKSK